MDLLDLRRRNFILPLVTVGALGLAIFVGMLVGTGDFSTLLKILGGVLFLVYAINLRFYTWIMGIIICVTDFFYAPFGFNVASVDITLGLGGLFVAVTWWLKPRLDKPPEMRRGSFVVMNLTLFIWVVYIIGHLAFNVFDPYSPQDYAFKNLIKSYVAFAAPQLVALCLMQRPTMFRITPLFPYRVAQCVLVGLVVNICIRGYQLFSGNYDIEAGPGEDAIGFFRIPYLELYENVYALRNLTPFAALFGCAFVYTKWYEDLPVMRRLVVLLIIPLAIMGAAISGGRATLLFVVAMISTILFLRRRFGVLISGALALILMICFANLLSSQVQKAPALVQRSIAWAIVSGSDDVKGGISHSTDWRKRLFLRTLDEWRSDARIFWFGRGSYAYGVQDYVAMLTLGKEEAMMLSAQRRGATHNLVSDLLIIFGVAGLFLYSLTVVAVLKFLWDVYRSHETLESIRQLALVCSLLFSFSFLYGLLGGGAYPPLVAWLLILLTAALYQLRPAPAVPNRVAPTHRKSLPVSQRGFLTFPVH